MLVSTAASAAPGSAGPPSFAAARPPVAHAITDLQFFGHPRSLVDRLLHRHLSNDALDGRNARTVLTVRSGVILIDLIAYADSTVQHIQTFRPSAALVAK